MPFLRDHAAIEPPLADVEGIPGWLLLEFGAPWCGHCQAAQPALQQFVDAHELLHLKVEDGKGRPLGRAFKVKLWPTAVLLHDGTEVARVVRPQTMADLQSLAAALPD
ncbi:thioredoxin family protein [uncultured Stenotrophomonas sp.]|uniref:thioredoxin family protein n=1 Tax=uncultured Stenotrophomonas sp. TaxID=165438 RepID=UPI0025F87C77|nr:thioredoxin family protein [uncultured Stenotrophomonas sp.]